MIKGKVTLYYKVLSLCLFFMVVAYFVIYFLTSDDGGTAVKQFTFKTKEGVKYTITIDKYINDLGGFNIRMFTLDTSSAPLSNINSVHFYYDGLYYDCTMGIEMPFCQYNKKAIDGVSYLNAYPVHEIY